MANNGCHGDDHHVIPKIPPLWYFLKFCLAFPRNISRQNYYLFTKRWYYVVQNNTKVALHSGKNTSFFVSKLTCDIFKNALEVCKISIPSLRDEIFTTNN
jgi:uncharacterized protein YbcV (DUF1398 family)